MKHVVFVATEDWFFVSHFLPLVAAARAAGCHVSVIARERAHRAVIEEAGARFIPLEAERGSLSPWAVLSSFWRLYRLMKRLQPDLVHCIALRTILTGGLAARLAGVQHRFYAVTGLGYLGAQSSLILPVLRFFLKALFAGRHVHYLFENPDDPVALGLDPADETALTILGGAGVDPDHLKPALLPDGPSLKVAFVSRMLWSKGPDLAVGAVLLAREKGADVTLSLYGTPDASNPKAIDEKQLQQWASQPGIAYHGRVEDMALLWQNHHLCLLPSRGGEGLPRVLLEAASCGRALLTTDVAGCRFLVRDGIEGFVVERDNAAELAEKLVYLSSHFQELETLGNAARSRIEKGFTINHLITTMTALYKSHLA
jgi:glycosyltransferase involved in cell wall biosynthesis